MQYKLFSEPQAMNLDISKNADQACMGKALAIQTWKDVYGYRRETAFALKSASEIILEYGVLTTQIAPELVNDYKVYYIQLMI